MTDSDDLLTESSASRQDRQWSWIEGAGRKLLLMRHAKSAWPDVPDHERPLARRGVQAAAVMGHWLQTNGYVPDQVLCSTARRACETWQLVQTELESVPPVTFDDQVYGGSASQLLNLIRRAGTTRTLLVVGHDPALPRLAVTLASVPAAGPLIGAGATGPPNAVGRMRTKFPTAAIAVLEFTGRWDQLSPETAQLTCFATPRDLSSRAAQPL